MATGQTILAKTRYADEKKNDKRRSWRIRIKKCIGMDEFPKIDECVKRCRFFSHIFL